MDAIARLRQRQRPLGVGIIGIGAMGKGLAYQCHVTPGFACLAVADLDVDKARAALTELGMPCRAVKNRAEAHAAIGRGEIAVTGDGALLAELAELDVIIEASSAIAEAGRFAATALRCGKHVILMNAEIDLVFGPVLHALAAEHGVVCTSCDGDQHGVLMRLINEVELWGFRLVMAGNIKGFLDRYANPTTIVPEADKRKLDYRMCTAYADGSKLCIEMALVANAIGGKVARPGMIGPRAGHAREALSLFDWGALWDGETPLVDYLLAAEPEGGVFVVGYCDHAYQRGMMAYYKMGAGPFYVFTRPYHLCHVEAMRGIAEAVVDGTRLLVPTHGMRTHVSAYAKTDLTAGQRLDGLGGYHCYGQIENSPEVGPSDALPICFAEGLPLRRALRKDERIGLADVVLDEGRFDFQLYQRALATKPGPR